MIMKPKGTFDIVGDKTILFDHTENILKGIATLYNFKRIRTPNFESFELFSKSNGLETEIVQKQMYEFRDKSNRHFVLRPEGTASFIRAFVENKLYASPLKNKFYYLGNMYRYEQPQKGRQREFTQFGVEYVCKQCPLKDTELILMARTIFDSFKIKNIRLEINSIGDLNTRKKYILELKKYLNKFKNNLSKNSLERLKKNPLRILDDKDEQKKSYFKNIPLISDFYSKKEVTYFNNIKNILKSLDIPYIVNHKLVRGLDYYSNLIFEFIDMNNSSVSQNTIIGGGRYTISNPSGKGDFSGIGFAVGIERLIDSISSQECKNILKNEKLTNVFIACLNKDAIFFSYAICNMLRKSGFITLNLNSIVKINKAFKLANKFNSEFIIFVGSKEMKDGKVTIKNQKTKKQVIIDIKNVIDYLSKKNKNENYL